MDEDKVQKARDMVEHIFNEMNDILIPVLPTPEEEPISKEESEKPLSLITMVEHAGISIKELESPRFGKVLGNLGDKEEDIYSLLTAAYPPIILKLILEYNTSASNIEIAFGVYAELSAAYMYAIIKMSATENLDSITTPFEGIDLDDDNDIPVLKQKVACIVAGYCTAISMATAKIAKNEAIEEIHSLLRSYAAVIRKPIYDYVSEERQKNNLGG